MPRQAPRDDVSALRAQKAALDASLREGHARLRKEQKAACARRSRELAARRRALERACVILALHDSDRAWLPAYMREHGMSGVGEELAAFDEELCSQFLSLPLESINRILAPTELRGRGMLRDARAFITKHQLHTWVTKQNESHGIAPTVGDTLTQRDELSAAKVVEAAAPPMWSVATSARYKWATRFRRRWRLGTRKPQARAAVPVHIAREKAELAGNTDGMSPWDARTCLGLRSCASSSASPSRPGATRGNPRKTSLPYPPAPDDAATPFPSPPTGKAAPESNPFSGQKKGTERQSGYCFWDRILVPKSRRPTGRPF